MNDLRRWMELCEARQRYYHGSRKAFPVGFVLKPQLDGYVHGVHGDELDAGIRRVEAFIDRYRPAHMISRLEAVFLSPSVKGIIYAGGYKDHVYLVEPIGACEQSSLWWYQQIEDHLLHGRHIPAKLGRQYAANYWNNVPPPEGKPVTYEFRCREARIVREI